MTERESKAHPSRDCDHAHGLGRTAWIQVKTGGWYCEKCEKTLARKPNPNNLNRRGKEREDGKAWRGLVRNGVFVKSGKKTGAPKKIKDPVTLNFVLERKMREEIHAYCAEARIWESDLVRRAIRAYLDALRKHGVRNLPGQFRQRKHESKWIHKHKAELWKHGMPAYREKREKRAIESNSNLLMFRSPLYVNK